MIVRICFSKGYEVKYVSHLDLMRTFHRMLKRSGLPISYSQGFNPHIILTFAQPLSVGVTSEGEYAEFQLEEERSAEEIAERLNRSAPEGIRVLQVTDCREPKFKELYAAEYQVTLRCNQTAETLMHYLSSPQIMVEKKTKKGYREVDIRPMIFDFSAEERENGVLLSLKLASGSEQNLNPDLLIKALEKNIDGFQLFYKSVHRLRLTTKENRQLIQN